MESPVGVTRDVSRESQHLKNRPHRRFAWFRRDSAAKGILPSAELSEFSKLSCEEAAGVIKRARNGNWE
jgi:hypothetical protein